MDVTVQVSCLYCCLPLLYVSVCVGVRSISPPPLAAFPPAVLESELPTDLFSAIFKSQSHQECCAWRALLAHAVALQRPLLAVVAASYEVCYMFNYSCGYSTFCLGLISGGVYLRLAALCTWLHSI